VAGQGKEATNQPEETGMTTEVDLQASWDRFLESVTRFLEALAAYALEWLIRTGLLGKVLDAVFGLFKRVRRT
jgi:hypothetical protein